MLFSRDVPDGVGSITSLGLHIYLMNNLIKKIKNRYVVFSEKKQLSLVELCFVIPSENIFSGYIAVL